MLHSRGEAGQNGDPAEREQPALVQYLWREILLTEPDTNPWEFACKVAKMGLITKKEIWDTAEWADQVREGVRTIRALQSIKNVHAVPLTV